ncbi:hypothetical protein V2W45_1207405, partial [Cenococcum geophilum]
LTRSPSSYDHLVRIITRLARLPGSHDYLDLPAPTSIQLAQSPSSHDYLVRIIAQLAQSP